jgi:hypothetical protein
MFHGQFKFIVSPTAFSLENRVVDNDITLVDRRIIEAVDASVIHALSHQMFVLGRRWEQPM